MINIVCVQKNNYLGRGSEYVNKLHDMVTRNLSDKTKGRFICFTDNPEGLNHGIEAKELPDFLSGWWNKLYLFKGGLFKDGERIFYFDLDTIIVGGIDEIIKYNGDFAILRDFYRPDGYGSAVMSWIAGKFDYIWDSYESAGYPNIEGGDQSFIEMMVKNADIWQELYPSCFVSYKADCSVSFPRDAKVVCFHGLPRPHEVDDEWVKNIWRIGGGSSLNLEICANTPLSKIKENIEYSMIQNLPIIESQLPKHDLVANIIGGGPSINQFIEQIRSSSKNNETIVALNNSYKWLKENDIQPNIQIMLDAREENSKFVPVSDKRCELFYASQCHRSVIDLAKNLNTTIWHANIPELLDSFKDRDMFWVGSGTTVGIRSIILLYILGYRKFNIYGYDSSYTDGNGHGYKQSLNEGEKTIEAEIAGRKFISAPWMVTQTEEFLQVMEYFTGEGCEFSIYGDGLLQHAVRTSLVEIEDHGDMAFINGIFWPKNDRICRPSMMATVSDVSKYLKHIKHRNVAVQAGGNVGIFPKELAKFFRRVYTFEPDKENWNCLIKNATEDNITKINAALGDCERSVSIKSVRDNCGASYVSDGLDVDLKTIDGLNLEGCDLIQLDIEGYEIFALRGAIETIKKYKPLIIIEDNGLSMRYNVLKGECDKMLRDLNYEVVDRVHRDVIYKSRENK